MLIKGIIVMIAVSMASHMGLTDSIASIIAKIIRCPKCFTFWCTVSLLLATSSDYLSIVFTALVVSYLSYWMSAVMTVISYYYEALWQKMLRLSKRKRQTKNLLS